MLLLPLPQPQQQHKNYTGISRLCLCRWQFVVVRVIVNCSFLLVMFLLLVFYEFLFRFPTKKNVKFELNAAQHTRGYGQAHTHTRTPLAQHNTQHVLRYFVNAAPSVSVLLLCMYMLNAACVGVYRVLPTPAVAAQPATTTSLLLVLLLLRLLYFYVCVFVCGCPT